jgi:hypothetical protein
LDTPNSLLQFTGSYTYRGFRSCIAINPWDKRGTATAINQALTMSDAEASTRWEELHAHVVAQSAQAFIAAFLQRTLRAGLEHLRQNQANDAAGGVGGVGTPKLDITRIQPRWRHSARRFVGVDLEGTLWTGRDPRDTSARTPVEVVQTLQKLAEDEKNEVWVFSGLPIKGALEELAKEVPRVGIVAENGCFIRPRVLDEAHGMDVGWISRVENKNLDWKGPCLEILHYVGPFAFWDEPRG